jgi:hypothetical protein
MKCDEFYRLTKSVLNTGKITHNPNKSAAHVYYGLGMPVVFYDKWDVNKLSSLHQLEDIKDWENSSLYVEVHPYTLNDGVECVSLSATADVSHENDVRNVTLTGGQICIEGIIV